MRKERGFTLIELLIVLAILAILIGIVAMSIGNLRETAIQRGMQSEREVVETALNSYVTLDDAIPDDDMSEPAKVITTDDIGKYLKKDTKYWYTWENPGTSGQNIVVWNAATLDNATIACDVDGCYVDTDADNDAFDALVTAWTPEE